MTLKIVEQHKRLTISHNKFKDKKYRVVCDSKAMTLNCNAPIIVHFKNWEVFLRFDKKRREG